ncbi:MAG: phosphoribosylanthranilate isomerase [Syntrophomonadaceae bacterium]|nr:phosphoribosylanthranilate isomerase [Syntrophomonadaceae bacterium]MDD3889530.1 phosphoribosylanthranilate isomerase [Syntrophomonadaceae bacterium]MDD4549897.1 phosphoribosylanthranilate isomerase [Syntrophomonadaceae bacterium]
MTRVKICGIKTLEEALATIKYGAWALGEVFAESSRSIAIEDAAAINQIVGGQITKIGVFVNKDIDELNYITRLCKLDMVQLHGDESPEYIEAINVPVIKSFTVNGQIDLQHIKEWRAWAYLFDSYSADKKGGTGKSFNWDWLYKLGNCPNMILAGGLNSINVCGAIEKLHPMAVDVSSGVEFPREGKNPDEICRFMNAVREADKYVS